jgi:hypothetical protein
MYFENEKWKLEIVNDTHANSPREDVDYHIGKMVCFHNKYNLPKEIEINHNDFDGWNEMEKHLKKEFDFILPIYMYDHSGQTISTTQFGCKWDSGQIGFIVTNKAIVRKMYMVKNVTKKIAERVLIDLVAEIKEYDQYLTGDIYGFEVTNKETNESDSCYCFYGSNIWNNGMCEHIEDDCLESLKTELENEFGWKK